MPFQDYIYILSLWYEEYSIPPQSWPLYSPANPPRPAYGKSRTAKTIGFLVFRFPKVSETLILYELLDLRKLGFDADPYSLLQENAPIMYPEAEKILPDQALAQLVSAVLTNGKSLRLIPMCGYFCTANFASAIATWNLLRGYQIDSWIRVVARQRRSRMHFLPA